MFEIKYNEAYEEARKRLFEARESYDSHTIDIEDWEDKVIELRRAEDNYREVVSMIIDSNKIKN